METSNPVMMLECSDCGHKWKPRNTPGKARECSKCGSRNIGEFDPDETAEEDTQTKEETEVESKKIKPRIQSPCIDEF